MNEETLNTGSQPSTEQTSAPAPESTTSAPLNDAQMKSGMLNAINTELDAKKPADKLEILKLPDKKVEKTEEKPLEVKKEAEKKPTEDDLYVMPEGLQKESQKRFQKLVDVAKEATAKAQEIERSAKAHESTINNFRTILEETKTSPEDLNRLLDYNLMVKSGDLEGALAALDEQRAIIARYLGRPIDGVDYLDGFDDLKQELREGKITPERAAELAKSRNVAHVFRQENERAQKETATHEQKQKSVDTALEQISKFAESKSQSDIDYKRKEEILLKAVDKISASFPPELWLSQVEMLYDTINSLPSAAPPVAPTPLRPNAGGGGKPQARSMGDAIDQGLGYGAP